MLRLKKLEFIFRTLLINPKAKEIVDLSKYLEKRNEFFEKEMPDEVYQSLLMYLWYLKLKNSCPVTGTIMGKEYVNP